MKYIFKRMSGQDVVVWNSNLRFIYKDSAYLKMCFAILETSAPRDHRALNAHVYYWEEHNLG